MLDYIKAMAIIISFLAGFTAIMAVMAEIRQSGSESIQYENQF